MKQHMLLGITLLSLGLLHGCSGSDDDWMITSEGIGPLNAETAFDYSTLEELLPNLRINQGLGTAEGERFEVMYVYNTDTEKLFTLIPTPDAAVEENTTQEGEATAEIITDAAKSIQSIEIHSPVYKTASGHSLQSGFSEIYPETGKAKCLAGADESSGSVICTAPDSDHIRFMFSGDWAGADGALPPQDMLKDWTVDRLFWLAQVPVIEAEATAETETDSDKKSGS